MRIRVLLMPAISMLFAGITAAPAGAQCLAVDAYIIQNGSPAYLVPHHTCVLNTSFPAVHFGQTVGDPALPPVLQGVGFDIWIPV